MKQVLERSNWRMYVCRQHGSTADVFLSAAAEKVSTLIRSITLVPSFTFHFAIQANLFLRPCALRCCGPLTSEARKNLERHHTPTFSPILEIFTHPFEFWIFGAAANRRRDLSLCFPVLHFSNFQFSHFPFPLSHFVLELILLLFVVPKRISFLAPGYTFFFFYFFLLLFIYFFCFFFCVAYLAWLESRCWLLLFALL